MAYTYLIGWSNLAKYYYGVRYSKYADPSDLWITYKTSSKYVKEMADTAGPPDIVQVRKIFETKESAIKWESKVLRRMKVVANPNFLNKWDNNIVPLNLDGPYPFEDPLIQAKVERTFKENMAEK